VGVGVVTYARDASGAEAAYYYWHDTDTAAKWLDIDRYRGTPRDTNDTVSYRWEVGVQAKYRRGIPKILNTRQGWAREVGRNRTE
jgi:hypothetical protein